MKPEAVPVELVEKAAEATYLMHPDTERFDGKGEYAVVPYKALSKYRRRLREDDARQALAAVLPDIQAQALRDFADGLPAAWQRPNGLADAARAHAEHLLECTCAEVDLPAPDKPRRLLTPDQFEEIRTAVQDPEYVARLAAETKAQGLVEVDNPMRREVRPRRGTERPSDG